MSKLNQVQNALISGLGILTLLSTVASSAPRVPQRIGQVTNDISIQLTADRKTVKPSEKITYTVTMTNLGPDDATFVDVAFYLPNELVPVSMACDNGISPDGPFCEYSTLNSGATVVSMLVATLGPNAPARDRVITLSTSAMFEDPGPVDPNMSNNTASVKTKLIGRLSIP